MTTFESLKFRPELLKACQKQGFAEPTAIQAIVMPVVTQGRDVVVESQTGSGKTLAWGLPLLDREPLQTLLPEVLVVVPTRELAEQNAEALRRAAGALVRPIALLTGRGGLDRQKKALDAGAVFVVGTLGRIEEAIARSILRLDAVRTVVLDEVDELLRGGFSGQLAALLGSLPKERQTLLFSATVPTEVETVARKFTKNAARLRTSEAREHPTDLRHRVLFTNVAERVQNLAGYLKAERPYQTIVFCGTRHETEEVKAALDEAGLEVEFLHGELSPLKRRQLLDHFRTGDLPVLVASDLAARGLDLPGVDLIVNYSLPAGSAAYLHRAGRTGRAGREGTVLSLVIEQQHTPFERLRETFSFESMAVSSNGKLYSHPARSQTERDQLFGKRPEPAEKAPQRRFVDAPPPERGEERGAGKGAPKGASEGWSKGSAKVGVRGAPKGGASEGWSKGSAKVGVRGAPKGGASEGWSKGSAQEGGRGAAKGSSRARTQGSPMGAAKVGAKGAGQGGTEREANGWSKSGTQGAAKGDRRPASLTEPKGPRSGGKADALRGRPEGKRPESAPRGGSAGKSPKPSAAGPRTKGGPKRSPAPRGRG